MRWFVLFIATLGQAQAACSLTETECTKARKIAHDYDVVIHRYADALEARGLSNEEIGKEGAALSTAWLRHQLNDASSAIREQAEVYIRCEAAFATGRPAIDCDPND